MTEYHFELINRYSIFAGIEEGGLGLKSLETNDPPTDGSGWVVFGLIVFFVGILGSAGFFFKERIIRYRVTWRDKNNIYRKKECIIKHTGVTGALYSALLARFLTGEYVGVVWPFLKNTYDQIVFSLHVYNLLSLILNL